MGEPPSVRPNNANFPARLGIHCPVAAGVEKESDSGIPTYFVSSPIADIYSQAYDFWVRFDVTVSIQGIFAAVAQW